MGLKGPSVTDTLGQEKGKEPSELDLSTLKKLLPFWEKQAADENNKFAAANKRLVSVILEVIAEKTAKTESPAAAEKPTQTGEVEGPPPPPAGDVPPDDKHALAVEDWKRELAEAESLEKLAALWKTLSQDKVWSNFKGPEQVAMKREHDKKKVALMTASGQLV